MKLPLLLLLSLFALSVTAEEKDCTDISTVGIEGEIVTSEDGQDVYNDARQQFASTLGSVELSDTMLSPDIIVYPASEDDLSKIVTFTSDCGK